jgi:quinol monooxygenase YgiN
MVWRQIEAVARWTDSVGTNRRKHTMALGKVLAVMSHPVKDFAAWKVTYDGAEPVRQLAGVTGAEVFQEPADPNEVVIIHRFPSLESEQGFLGDPGLKEAMMKGGVTAPPTVILAVAG